MWRSVSTHGVRTLMTLKDIARPKEELVTATAETSVRELAELMEDNKVGSVVIEKDGDVHGIITDRDIALKVVGAGKDPMNLVAGDIMTERPITADMGDGVYELCNLMRDNGVRRIPLTENGKLAGIVTLDDLFILLEDEMHDISEVIRAESPPFQPA